MVSLACHPIRGVGASEYVTVDDSEKLPLVLLKQFSSAMTFGSAPIFHILEVKYINFDSFSNNTRSGQT